MIKKNTNTLRKSVLATLAYYRAIKTPLTLVQVSRYLISENSHTPATSGDRPSPEGTLSEIKTILNGLIAKGVVQEQKGLYWLKISSDNSNITVIPAKAGIQKKIQKFFLDPGSRCSPERAALPGMTNTPKDCDGQQWLKFIQLEKNAQRKINKVRKALKIFSFLPFLRGIFLCGSVARKISRSGSDIDFLILTKQNRVWTVRFLLTVFSFLLGKKTNDATIKNEDKDSRRNKFCLNHYRSSSRLKLEEEIRDLYSAQEYARMINVYSSNRIERKFFKKNKDWMKKYLPNFNFTKLPLYNVETQNFASLQRRLENMLPEKIGNIIEKLLRFLQIKKINIRGNEFPAGARRIITNDEVIMFHLNPRAPIVLKKYNRVLTNTLEY